MTLLMNLVTRGLPYFGSGAASLFMMTLRRGILWFLYLPLSLGGLARAPRLLAAGPVLRAALGPVVHSGGVERAPDDVIAHARQVLHAAPADEHDGVLLQVMALARDVRGDLDSVREAHARDLPERRVRLLRGRGV